MDQITGGLSLDRVAGAFLASSPVAMLVADAQGRIALSNPAAVRLFGYTEQEFRGLSVENLVPLPLRPQHAKDRAEYMKSPEARPMGKGRELKGRHKSSKLIPVEIGLAPIEIDNQPLVLATVVDLTERVRREKALRQLLEKASEIAQVGGWELDVESGAGPIWSDEVCRIHGVPLGHRPSLEEAISYYTPESRKEVERAVQRGVEGQEGWDLIGTLRTANGDLRRVRAAGEPEVVDGRCVRLWGALQDVTEESEAQRMLEQYRLTTEHSSEAIYWLRRDGSFFYVNQAACEMLGYTKEQLLAMKAADIDPAFPVDTWPQFWDQMRQERRQGFETRHQKSNGEMVWVKAWIHFFEFQGEEFLMGTTRDITEQRRYRETLAESELRYRTLYEESPLMHANIDLHTAEILDCNQPLVERLGYASKSELIGRPVFDLYHADCQRRARQAFEQYSKTGRVVNRALEVVTRAGDSIPVILNVSVVRDNQGQMLYSSSTWSDVTELKRYTNELEHANNELERFAYVASHDLKAPLRAIDHLANWLGEDLAGQLPEASATHLGQLRQRVARMERLLDDLLAYSRAGRVRAEPAEVWLSHLVTESVRLLDLAGRFRVSTSLKIDQLFGQATPLETVIRNLIGNAVKHHDKQSGEVVVSADADQEDDRRVRIIVADDGPGIAPEYSDRVFRMFQTLKPRDDMEGSGMGLALVRKLVEVEGGRVWIEPNEPRGARVCFTWPRRVT